MTLFSLLSVFSATIAWFSTNKEVGGSNNDFDVVSGNGRLNKVYFHSYVDFNTKDGADDYQFNKTPFMTYTYNWETSEMDTQVNPKADDWVINKYDPMSIKERYNSMLMVFEFDAEYTSSTAGDIFIKGNTEVTNYLGARDENSKPVYSLPATETIDEDPTSLLIKREAISDTKNKDYYALSSVAGFKTKTFTASAYSALTGGEGDTIDLAESTLNEGEAFTTINNSTNSFTFNQNPYIFKSTGSGTYQYVAVVLYYSPDAIGYIYSTYLGDSGLNGYDSMLDFACDWSLEVF